MNTETSSVACPGPPRVRKYTSPNTLAVVIVVNSRNKKTGPRIRGSVMKRKTFHAPAPSIRAASIRSSETPSMAAWTMIMAKAMPRQVLTTMIDAIGYSCSHDTVDCSLSPRRQHAGTSERGHNLRDHHRQQGRPSDQTLPADAGLRQQDRGQHAEQELADDGREEDELGSPAHGVDEVGRTEQPSVVLGSDELRRPRTESGQPLVGHAEPDCVNDRR